MTTHLIKSYGFILLSFSIGLLCLGYIRSKDRFEKEPYGHLLAVACWGGLCSYIISGLLYDLLAHWGVNDLRNTWGALLVIGPVEEGSKLAALFSSYIIIRKQLNEPVDGLLYMACVALGFSLIENYFYAMDAPTGGSRLFFARLLICTPSHINFSAFMGLAFYFLVQYRGGTWLILPAFAYAAVVHGLYDMVVFNGFFIALLALVIWLAYKGAVSLLGYATAKSQFRQNLWSFLNTYPRAYLMRGLKCPACGSKAYKPTYRLLSQTIQKCDQCDSHITTPGGLRAILHHFSAAPSRNFLGRPIIGKRIRGKAPESSIMESSIINRSSDGRRISFNLKVLNHLIVQQNRQTVRRMERHWWFPAKLVKKYAEMDIVK